MRKQLGVVSFLNRTQCPSVIERDVSVVYLDPIKTLTRAAGSFLSTNSQPWAEEARARSDSPGTQSGFVKGLDSVAAGGRGSGLAAGQTHPAGSRLGPSGGLSAAESSSGGRTAAEHTLALPAPERK